MHLPEILQRFDYPENLLNAINDVIDAFLPYSPCSTILIGSSARGEFSFIPSTLPAQLLSDLEFMMITDRELPRESIRKIRSNLNHIEESIAGRTSFFHIDVNVIPRKDLRSLPLAFHTFEVKNSGIILQGSDIRSEIPDVSLANLDYRELNETIIWRLWALLLHFPVSLARKGEGSSNSRFCYLVARNILDITTWGLPYEKILIAGFTDRVKYVSQHTDKLKILPGLDANIAELLESCLRTKLHYETDYEAKEIFGRALHIFANALRFLMKTPRCSDIDLMKGLPKHSRRLFRDYRLRRKIYDAILLFSPRTILSPVQALRWYLAGKHGTFAAWLLAMHMSMHEYLAGHVEAAQDLLERCRSFKIFLLFKKGSSKTESNDFLQVWIKMRTAAADFMIYYFRWAASQKNYIRKAIKQADA